MDAAKVRYRLSGIGGNYCFANGGGATLRSYGVTGPEYDPASLAPLLAAAMPPRHMDFLRGLAFSARFGDFFFCHAGVRPGVELDRQTQEDLTWIREPFLSDQRDFGAVVVHGHTPVHEPEVRPNRINLDTGAVFGGEMTCLVLEGTEHRNQQRAGFGRSRHRPRLYPRGCGTIRIYGFGAFQPCG